MAIQITKKLASFIVLDRSHDTLLLCPGFAINTLGKCSSQHNTHQNVYSAAFTTCMQVICPCVARFSGFHLSKTLDSSLPPGLLTGLFNIFILNGIYQSRGVC